MFIEIIGNIVPVLPEMMFKNIVNVRVERCSFFPCQLNDAEQSFVVFRAYVNDLAVTPRWKPIDQKCFIVVRFL